jgi:predicted transcriptional regulator
LFYNGEKFVEKSIIKKQGRPIARESVESVLNMRIKDFLSRYRPPSTTYITVKKGAKLFNVLKAIATGHPSIIIVVDDNRRPIGYLTDKRLLRSLYGGTRPRSLLAAFSMRQIDVPIEKALDLPVEQVMEYNPPTISGEDKVRDAVRMLYSLTTPIVIVVDKTGKIRAVLTPRFVIKAIMNKLLGEPISF